MGDRLVDKVAVVTGAGRGIGRAVALLLAQEGASVVVNDLGCDVDGQGSSREPADAVAQEIGRHKGKAVANYDNVATFPGAERLIKTAVDTFRRLDILVNSVAILRDRMFFQMSEEDWDAVVTNNLKGTFGPTKFASILFRQQRSGRIVNLTSDAGLGAVGQANYAAASEGITGFTRTVARDIGRYGATCNAASPLARTRLFPALVSEFRRERGLLTSDEIVGINVPEPADRWQGPGSPDAPENVAALVGWLCTDAASEVNGYIFGVRGGLIYLYSNPQVERAIYKAGKFTVDELMEQVPRTLTVGLVNPAPPQSV